MGVILRLSKEHSQPLLETVWMMRRQGIRKGSSFKAQTTSSRCQPW